MNWIRVAVGIGRDPSLLRVAEALGVSVPLTTGSVVLVLTAMAEGCKNGDLSTVSDSTLEGWAMWRGKRGRFAAEIRAHLCDAQGVMRSWDKYNGQKLREMEADAERKRQWRAERRASGGRPVDETKTSGGRPPLRDETRRDETVLQQTTTAPDVAIAPPARGIRKPKAEPKYPHFPAVLSDEIHEVWQSKAGAIAYPRIRKAFAPLLTAPDDVRPPRYPRNTEMVPAVSLYLDATSMTSEARFRTPERCAGVLSQIVGVMRGTTDALKRLEQAETVIGIVNRQAS